MAVARVKIVHITKLPEQFLPNEGKGYALLKTDNAGGDEPQLWGYNGNCWVAEGALRVYPAVSRARQAIELHGWPLQTVIPA